MNGVGKKSWIMPLMGCLISLAVFLLTIPAIFGYELKLYHPIAAALIAALAATALHAGMILGKKSLSGAGLLFVWLAPFLAALSMAGWPKMGGTVGTICGVGCLLLSQWTFWRCIESKKLRRCAAFGVIGLIAAGILIAWLMIVWKVRSDVLNETIFGMLFVGFYLLTGALAALCGMAKKRLGKNAAGIFVLLAAYGLMMMTILTHMAFAPKEVVILQSVVSPDGGLLAEKYVSDNKTNGSIRVRENGEGRHVLIGRIRRLPQSVYWHYASANVETLAWLDEETLLINGDAWPWRTAGR